jgi:hypothetical protein
MRQKRSLSLENTVEFFVYKSNEFLLVTPEFIFIWCSKSLELITKSKIVNWVGKELN